MLSLLERCPSSSETKLRTKFSFPIQLLGHLLWVARNIAEKENLNESGYRLGKKVVFSVLCARLSVVSDFGNGDCEVGEIHMCAQNFEGMSPRNFACACVFCQTHNRHHQN